MVMAMQLVSWRSAGIQRFIDPRPTLAEVIAKSKYGLCALCGWIVLVRETHPHPAAPTADHVVPRARGGSDHIDNLQLAHLLCNAIKGDDPSRYYPPSLRLLGLSRAW